MKQTRTETIRVLDKAWDVAVIGGGATGLGTAVDAASRGYRTILVEKHDFAKGTSGKSTKLVHGGVRYLANGDIRLVRSALRERGRIFRNAPHVSFVQSFVIPAYSWFGKVKFLIGLKMYDWMAIRHRIGTSVLLNKNEVVEKVPKVKTKGLLGGILYYDGQFDDARLAVNLAQTAAAHGATVLNYAEVIRIEKDESNNVCGLTFVDRETGEKHAISAKAVINATGVFVDDILRLDTPEHRDLVRPSQGAHIVVDSKFLGGRDALMIPETSDGRVLFGIPWHGKVLLGTTDTPISEHQIEPRPLEEEIDFILDTAGQYLDPAPGRKDVLSIFAGLRPLAAPTQGNPTGTKEISRDHKLVASESGLITITGGKWTTYRKMAEETVDLAAKVGGLAHKACRTADLPIRGHTTEKYPGHRQVYGSDAEAIAKLAEQHPEFREKLHPDHAFTVVEVVWACRHEMARKVEDVLARRTRFLLLDAKASLAAAPKVASVMARELGRDEDWIAQEIADYERLAENYMF